MQARHYGLAFQQEEWVSDVTSGQESFSAGVSVRGPGMCRYPCADAGAIMREIDK